MLNKNDFTLNCSQLKFKYPNQNKWLLNGIDLNIEPNKFIKIKGANGSGKSTFLLLLANLLSPSSGIILYNNKKISKMSFKELSNIVGIIFQNPSNQIFGLDVKSELSFGLRNKGLSECEINNKIDFITDYFGFENINNDSLKLSFGWKKILTFSSIYLLNPKVLIMDEPEIGLDPLTKYKIESLLLEYLKEGNSLIISSHNNSFLSAIDSLSYILENGILKKQ